MLLFVQFCFLENNFTLVKWYFTGHLQRTLLLRGKDTLLPRGGRAVVMLFFDFLIGNWITKITCTFCGLVMFHVLKHCSPKIFNYHSYKPSQSLHSLDNFIGLGWAELCLKRPHHKVFLDKIQITQAFPGFQMHTKRFFLCALRAEDVHCVGIKYLEFISLLSVSIQYLQVGELLLCSGGFCNLYFLLSIAIILLFCSLTATIPAIPAAIHSPAMPPVLTAMRNGMTVESARNRSWTATTTFKGLQLIAA